VVGIIGFVDVPIVYYSVHWWRSIHPTAVVGPLAESGSLEPIMQAILLFSFGAFLALFAYLLVERAALRAAEDQVRRLRFSMRRAGLR
jgi:heme exporter protein C